MKHFIADVYKYVDADAYINMQVAGSRDAEEEKIEYENKLSQFQEELLSVIDVDDDGKLTEAELKKKLKTFITDYVRVTK